MMNQAPDSVDWQQEADQYHINTIMVSVVRYGGIGYFPLSKFCQSQAWRPVYLDEVAAIFIRNKPENAEWLNRLQIDCATIPINPMATAARSSRLQDDGDRFNAFSNAGAVLYVLGRNADAMKSLQSANSIFPADGNLHLIMGEVFQANNQLQQAEQEYRNSLRLRATDTGWYALGRVYVLEHRYENAAHAFNLSAKLSYHPAEQYLLLAEDYVLMQRPHEALKEFDHAVSVNTYASNSPEGAPFYARIAAGRARALIIQSMADVDRAVEFQKQAVALTPRDPDRWAQLADLYKLQGRTELAQQANQHAMELRSK